MLAGLWAQLWPNLLANVLWVPLAGAHHILMRRQLRRVHSTLHTLAKGISDATRDS